MGEFVSFWVAKQLVELGIFLGLLAVVVVVFLLTGPRKKVRRD